MEEIPRKQVSKVMQLTKGCMTFSLFVFLVFSLLT
ncbi:Uncharacterised protein [Vibrio cholerae]|nr:Uncharacterised protein [Vibrio cholerae]